VSEKETSVLITNQVGLHARPARLLVQMAAQFRSQISLQYGAKKVNAKSIIGVLQLGARMGSTLVVRAEGEDAEQALTALSSLIERKFDEEE
jgi:phosphotransferase system HPr (HPr) family protein